jgi:ABC-type multidrug transport system permease subunit
MKKIQVPMLFLAFLVIFSHVLVGVAIGFRNYGLAAFFFFLGFAIMGYGLSLKRKKNGTAPQ